MPRLILTFESLFQVLSADKFLRGKVSCRTTPTPPGLSASICGMSIEILEPEQKELAIAELDKSSLKPSGIHYL